MSMVVSFCAVLFPRGVLDEILNLIGSVSEGFLSYSTCGMLIIPHALHCVDSCILYFTSTDTDWHTVLISVPPHFFQI